jgi:hypothetical protein
MELTIARQVGRHGETTVPQRTRTEAACLSILHLPVQPRQRLAEPGVGERSHQLRLTIGTEFKTSGQLVKVMAKLSEKAAASMVLEQASEGQASGPDSHGY